MPKLILTDADVTESVDELACYLQTDSKDIDFDATYNLATQHNVEQSCYQLLSGKLRLLTITLYLPVVTNNVDIEAARNSSIKSALVWHKRCLQQDANDQMMPYYVLALDIQLQNSTSNIKQSVAHSFGARYFMEELVLDSSETTSVLQIFSWQDWQALLAIVKTPCELWRFLGFYSAQLQRSFVTGAPIFDSEQRLLMQFMASPVIFTQAIAVDNALVKYAMQDEPNRALVTMSLAQRNASPTMTRYRQHMQQAAIVWAQLTTQMIELTTESSTANELASIVQSLQWQQQLLDESLFSRHELVRTLYRHPQQPSAMLEQGYVVHQHSYESLGRHYVLIFYGQGIDTKQSRALIKPNLHTIAQDVATRLPLAELHHVIVMGIEFVSDEADTFMDVDLWIQTVTVMTQKERQLTRQLQILKQKESQQQLLSATIAKEMINKEDINKKDSHQKSYANVIPSIKLNLSIPSRSK